MTPLHLSGLLLTMLRLCVWLVLLSALFVPLERLFALRPQKVFRRAVLTDLAYYFLSSLIPGLVLAVPLSVLGVLLHRMLPQAVTEAATHWPLAARLAAAFAVGELGFYWGHRWSHELPLLWRFHAVHHSAEHLDFLVNTRAHPVDLLFTRLCGLLPLYVLGLAAPAAGAGSVLPLLVLLVGTVWGFFIHANLRWRFGPLEWLIATPAFHHWHHANDGPQVINKNYAAMLPCLDRVFGTHYLPADRSPTRYGIDAPTPHGLLRQLLAPAVPAVVPVAATPADQGRL